MDTEVTESSSIKSFSMSSTSEDNGNLSDERSSTSSSNLLQNKYPKIFNRGGSSISEKSFTNMSSSTSEDNGNLSDERSSTSSSNLTRLKYEKTSNRSNSSDGDEVLDLYNSDVDQTSLGLGSDRDSNDGENNQSLPPLHVKSSPIMSSDDSNKGDSDESEEDNQKNNTAETDSEDENLKQSASAGSASLPLCSLAHHNHSSLLATLGSLCDDPQLRKAEMWEPFPLDPPPSLEDQQARFEAIQEFLRLASNRSHLWDQEIEDLQLRITDTKSAAIDESLEQRQTTTKSNLKPPPRESSIDEDDEDDPDQDGEFYEEEELNYEDEEIEDNIVPLEAKSNADPAPTTATRKRKPSKDAAAAALEGPPAHARFRGYQEEQWQKQFKELVEFKKKTGHCCVPHDYSENPALSRWVKRQRYQYRLRQEGKNSTMIESRTEALGSLGFVWYSQTAAWEERLYELKMFKVVYGHCNVPSTFPANPQLTTWVKGQRRQYKFLSSGKRSNLTPERIEKLNEIGFNWNVRGSTKILS